MYQSRNGFIEDFHTELAQFTASFENLVKQKEHLESEVRYCEKNLSNHSREDAAISTASECAIFYKPLALAVSSLKDSPFDIAKEAIVSQLSNMSEIISEKAEKYRDLSDLTDEEFCEKKQKLEARLLAFRSHSTDERMKNCFVLGATLDSCINRVHPVEFSPDHVFLDEAAYASLIKGATLTVYHAPITFLGDHMQLPPVCEIDNRNLSIEENAPVVLWAQSALYLEDIFTDDFNVLLNRYLNDSPPHFEILKLSFLSHSFRYGNELAALLSKHIYGRILYGNASSGTEILVIDAPKGKGNSFHENLSEAQAISHYLAQHPESDFAVLTPYHNQIKLLANYIPRDNLFTIHGSQGREWDTVFLSIANQRPWQFTDSMLPIGKRIINTAASRTRKKLIVVCDTGAWNKYPQQFITELTNISGENIHEIE